MSRRIVGVLVILFAVGMATVPVAQAAEITNVDATDTEIVIDGEQTTVEHELFVENTGENATMADVTITESPTGVTVDHLGAERLEPGATTRVSIEITAEATADSGEIRGTVNGEAFAFNVEVVNPPLPGFEDEPIDIGDVLVGEETAGDLVVEEVGGDQGLDGVEAEVVDADPDATLFFNDMEGGFSSEGIQTSPGGQDTAEWVIEVDDEVPQYEELSWTVELNSVDHPQATRTVDVEARVISLPKFGQGVLIDDEIVFDEPRDEVNTIDRTYEFQINNDGDLALPLEDVRASSDELDVQVENFPEEIDGQSRGTIELGISADTDLSEDEYTISVTPEPGEFNIEETEYEGTIQDSFFSYTIEATDYEAATQVIHETRLAAPTTVRIGDVPIGESDSGTATIEEELGYNDIENVDIGLESGPNNWMTIDSQPAQVNAGSSSTVAFALDFDTDAELGNDYQWEYSVTGNGVETKTVAVTASPVPLDLGPIRNDLSTYDDPVAAETITIVDRMDERMQAGKTAGDDIPTILTFGESTTLYLGSIEDARSLVDDGDHEAAQSQIIRAAAAYNSMSLYADRIEDGQQRASSQDVLTLADEELGTVIDEQERYYETQLDSGELSLLEEATVQRQLAQIALLQGDTENAEALEADADEAFASYSEAVSNGERAAQAANERWSALEDEQFVSIAGQQLLLNPAEYDTFTNRADSLDESYDEAAAEFESAGETSRAEAITAEQQDRMEAIETAELSLFVATGVYVVIMLGIVVRTGRRMYWYVRDAREAVSGDFLMQ